MAGRAAIYTRISNDRDGNERGVERQEDLCRGLAARHGLDVVAIFRDNDISASTRSSKPRPQYTEMLRRARLHEFDVILAYSNSRLTRRVREYLDIIELVKETGLQIKTVASGELDLSTADGQAVATTIAAWDQAEADRISERIKVAKAQRAAKGEWNGGRPPFGYRTVNKKPTPYAEEVKLVDEAVRRVIAGDTVSSIAKDWNNRGVPTRDGGYWRAVAIRSILMNRSMLGETKTGVQGWEPIIDARDFDRLQSILNDPAKRPASTSVIRAGTYTLSGIAFCANTKEDGEVCGKRLVTGKHNGYASMKCSKHGTGPDACGKVAIGHDALEEYVFEKVLAALEKNPRWGQRRSEPDPRTDTLLKEAEAHRDELEVRRERLVDAIADGVITKDDAKAKMASITAEKDAVQKEIGRLLGSTVIQDAHEDGFDWQSWTPMRRRNFLRQLLQRVEVYPFPEGIRRGLTQLKDEGDEAFEARRHAHRWAIMDQRVRIIPN